MTTAPLPPLPNLRGGIVKHTILGELYDRLQVEQRMVAYAAQARADLEAENKRLREVLEQAVRDTPKRYTTRIVNGDRAAQYPAWVNAAITLLESKP